MLQRLHFAQAHTDVEAEFLADTNLDGVGAALSTALQHLTRTLGERCRVQVWRLDAIDHLIRLHVHLTYPCASRIADTGDMIEFR